MVINLTPFLKVARRGSIPPFRRAQCHEDDFQFLIGLTPFCEMPRFRELSGALFLFHKIEYNKCGHGHITDPPVSCRSSPSMADKGRDDSKEVGTKDSAVAAKKTALSFFISNNVL